MKNPLKFIKNRYKTDSVKWDLCDLKFNKKDLLPMWVADMDISTAPKVIEAIKKRAQSGIFGYTFISSDYKKIVVNWIKNQNNWSIPKNWIHYAPGVGSAIYMLVRALTSINDGVLVQTPVYYVFFDAIEKNNRRLIINELLLNNGKYEIDFIDFENKLKEVSLFILSSPHNPVGRVWTKKELLKIGELCLKHNVKIVSDEVHSDLMLFGNKFISIASISKGISNITATCTSPSKAFNLAGLQLANIIIANTEIAELYDKQLELIGLFGPNSIASEAMKAAYTKSYSWLRSLNSYFESITLFIDKFLKENIPIIQLVLPQSTYLLWLDFRELNLSNQQLDELIFDKCKLGFDQGYIFGKGGDGFMRINIATNRKNIEIALKKIEKYVKNVGKLSEKS